MSNIRKITGGIEYEYGGILQSTTSGFSIRMPDGNYLRIDVEQGQIINNIMVDFEDMFLCDKEKILRIQFNPKISSVKTVIEEQKLHTLGSQYPFFFRNGNISYKELPISGLISTQADPQHLFMNFDDEADLFYKERQYKFAVENWLNNGEIKYLKTPSEGNYWVRLMNISLSPMEQLGRRLHTFSATAYEVSPPNWYTSVINTSATVSEYAAEPVEPAILTSPEELESEATANG